MKWPTHSGMRRKHCTVSAVLVGLVMLTVLAACSLPATQAGNPPDDCWGGALSADPLHCYVLDQAHSAGVIEVDAVYEANGVLHRYLTLTEPVGNEVAAFFEQKATEFVERWPDRVSYDHPSYDACVAYYGPIHGANHEDCLLNIVTQWEYDLMMLPYTTSYVKGNCSDLMR